MLTKKDTLVKIALWQTAPIHVPEQALAALDRAAGRARAKGAHLILTPEMSLGGYNIGPDRCQSLAASAGTLIDALKTIARKHRIALVVGLALAGPDKPLNGVIVVDRDGAERHRYHKTHLFGAVDRAQFTPGSALSGVVMLNDWAIGLGICYDIEFPELARALALEGADLILVPTANMVPFDSVATRLVPARAEENAIYVAYANYIGTEGQFTYGGLSCVCGPDGEDLARAGRDTPDLLIAELSRTRLAAQRKLQTHLADRRNDLYAPLASEGHADE